MGMTLGEARDSAGKRVKYNPGYAGGIEYGVVTGFSDLVHVFVRYDGDRSSTATNPCDLELVES